MFRNLTLVLALSTTATLIADPTSSAASIKCSAPTAETSKAAFIEDTMLVWKKQPTVDAHCALLQHYRDESSKAAKKAEEFEAMLRKGKFVENSKLPIAPGTKAHAEYFANHFRNESARLEAMAQRQEKEGAEQLSAKVDPNRK
jgi:hypothetical protein